MDILCHAVEAYWYIHHQPVCNAQARKNGRSIAEIKYRINQKTI